MGYGGLWPIRRDAVDGTLPRYDSYCRGKLDIWQADKLFLFIAFVMPGFISIKCYQLFHPGIVRNVADQIVDAIAYSCINYSLFLWLIFAVEGARCKRFTRYSTVCSMSWCCSLAR